MTADKFVFKKIVPIKARVSSPVAATVDAPLNPNHANQRMKTPRAPIVKLWPGMTCAFPSLYFPIRGPTTGSPDGNSNATYHMHGCGSSEVNEAHLSQPTAAPDPVSGDRVDQQGNDERVHEIRAEFCPFLAAPDTIVAAVAANTFWNMKWTVQNELGESSPSINKAGVPMMPAISSPNMML